MEGATEAPGTMTTPRYLILDIETSPHQAFVWGLFRQNIATSQVLNTGAVLCWSAKWLDEKGVRFQSVLQGRKRMIRGIHRLLNQADVVVTYNGNSFDLPTLEKEFVLQGLSPVRPYKSVDLCKVVQKQFRFASSKLDFVCQALGLGKKVRHAGFDLWVRCMAKDPVAWRTMERYNRRDVTILERLYERLKPWVHSHPNVATITDDDCCPLCGSARYQRRGKAFTSVLSYPRYQCQDCGRWFRGAHSLPTERKDRFRAITS